MFATTEALAFPRSAELARSFKNDSFLKTEEFSSHRMFFCSTIDFRTPSELFSQKKFSSLFKRDSVFSM